MSGNDGKEIWLVRVTTAELTHGIKLYAHGIARAFLRAGTRVLG